MHGTAPGDSPGARPVLNSRRLGAAGCRRRQLAQYTWPLMSVTSACARCQSPIDTGARFCPVCGLSVSGEQTAPLPTLMQVLRQATLGEYEILQEIGQGGMATVFLAHEIALDRKVAIKVMSPHFVHGADMIERFKREARTAASLNHPHIIPIYAVRESQHLLFFIMKYIQGRSVDAILRDVGPLPFPMVRSILSDIGAALDYAHRQGVVHRDVKPGNIMIDEEGFAVITDFGIARAAQSDSLTRSGTTVGTPSYLSPEACSGEQVGPAADQYSLGIVGYEMVTGALALRGGLEPRHDVRPGTFSAPAQRSAPPGLSARFARSDNADAGEGPADRFPTLKEAVLVLSGSRSAKRGGGERGNGDDSVRSHIGLLAVSRPGRGGESRRTPMSPAPLSTHSAYHPHACAAPAGAVRAGADRPVSRRPWRGRGAGHAPRSFGERHHPAGQRVGDPAITRRRQGGQRSPRHPWRGGVRARARRSGAGTAQCACARRFPAGGRRVARRRRGQDETRRSSCSELPPSTAPPRVPSRPGARQRHRTPRPSRWSSPRRPAPPCQRAEPGPRLRCRAGHQTSALAEADTVAIGQFYTELERAVESRQLTEVQRLLPEHERQRDPRLAGVLRERGYPVARRHLPGAGRDPAGRGGLRPGAGRPWWSIG